MELDALGIDKKQSHRWQAMASFPEPELEAGVEAEVEAVLELELQAARWNANPYDPTIDPTTQSSVGVARWPEWGLRSRVPGA